MLTTSVRGATSSSIYGQLLYTSGARIEKTNREIIDDYHRRFRVFPVLRRSSVGNIGIGKQIDYNGICVQYHSCILI